MQSLDVDALPGYRRRYEVTSRPMTVAFYVTCRPEREV